MLAAPITARTAQICLPRGDVYSFCAFFHIKKRVTQSGLNNEQFIEPHAFLMANDLAPRPPPPPSVSSTGET